MYRRYYDGYGGARSSADTGEVIVPQSSSESTYEAENSSVCTTDNNAEIEITSRHEKKSNMSMELDDLILIGILLFLLHESDDIDPVLIIVIGYLLLSDIL